MVAQILTCCDLRFIGAFNRLKLEEIKNLPSEELGINTPEGRPYVMITLMSKARLMYEEAMKTETPENITLFHKLLKEKGLEIPEKPTNVLSWKLTGAEEKVLHEVGMSREPLTADELVLVSTHLLG